MEEEIKKRGRPKKDPNDTTKAPYHKPRVVKPKGTHGGKREGAGRKKGVAVGPYKDSGELVTAHVTINVREVTKTRVKSLRELTNEDTMSFNRMFEAWVEDMAKVYGLE